MNQQRRTRYLAAMGVSRWVPRQILAGAPGGHRVVAPAQPAPAARTPLRAVASPVGSTGGARAQAKALLSGESGAPAVPTAAPTAVASITPAPVSTSPSATFELVCNIYDDWLLVDDVTAMRFAGSAYQQWIAAILSALGVVVPTDLALRQERFKWPVADAGQFDTSLDAASQAVQAWLLRRLADGGQGPQPSMQILLMGDAAVHNLAVDGSTAPAPGARVALGNGLGTGLVTHGSTRLWQQPLLKREFWHHLAAIQRTPTEPAL